MKNNKNNISTPIHGGYFLSIHDFRKYLNVLRYIFLDT